MNASEHGDKEHKQFAQGFLSAVFLFHTIYIWLVSTFENAGSFDWFFCATYFAWNRYSSISEWFPTIEQHIKVQEEVVSAKYFTTEWKVLIKMAQCIRKQNMDTMLWLLCLVRNKQTVNKLQLHCFTSFCKIFRKKFYENTT